MAAPQPTLFMTGPDASLDAKDVYNDESISVINTDPSTSTEFLSESSLPANAIADVAADTEAATAAVAEGSTIAETAAKAKEASPAGVDFKSIAAKNKMADIIDAGVRLKKHMGKRGFDQMNTGDFNFAIKEVKKFGNKMSGGSGLTLKDLKNAQGATDYAVIAVVGVLEVRKAMQPPNKGGIMGIIRRTSFPGILKDYAFESLMEQAAEYGLCDITSALWDLVEAKLTKEKKRLTAEKLIRNFKFQTKPIYTTISKEEKKVVSATSEFFGSGKKLAKSLGNLTELLSLNEEFPARDEQMRRLIKALYKLDPNWNSCIRDGEVVGRLDLYTVASKDAREALLSDDRTRSDMMLVMDRKLRKSSWKPIAKIWYPKIYI